MTFLSRKHLTRMLAVCSQGVNVFIFLGHQNDSISSRCYRENRHSAQRVINILFRVFEEDHCRKSHENDVEWARGLLKGDNS